MQWRNGLLLLHRVREGDTSKLIFLLLLFDLWSAQEAPTYWAFSPFHCASGAIWPYDVEFFGNFLCNFKRISFSDTIIGHCQLLVWPLHFSSPRFSSPLQNFLNHPCTVCSLIVPGPNMLLTLQAVSTALPPILNSNKKIAQICFLSNNIFLVKNKYKINSKW